MRKVVFLCTVFLPTLALVSCDSADTMEEEVGEPLRYYFRWLGTASEPPTFDEVSSITYTYTCYDASGAVSVGPDTYTGDVRNHVGSVRTRSICDGYGIEVDANYDSPREHALEIQLRTGEWTDGSIVLDDEIHDAATLQPGEAASMRHGTAK